MRKLFLFICFFTLLTYINITDIYAADADVMTSGQLSNSGVNEEYNNQYVDNALEESTDEVEILKAILICVRDIDIYVQYLIIVVAGVFLFWLTIWKPLMTFLE